MPKARSISAKRRATSSCLSFSDSDLGALAAESASAARWPVQPASRQPRAAKRHPYSVDLYAERVVGKARFVLVRLLGGLDYWRYGVEELSPHRAKPKASRWPIVPGDASRGRATGRRPRRLPVADLRRLWAFFQHGGSGNMGSLHGWIETLSRHDQHAMVGAQTGASRPGAMSPGVATVARVRKRPCLSSRSTARWFWPAIAHRSSPSPMHSPPSGRWA